MNAFLNRTAPAEPGPMLPAFSHMTRHWDPENERCYRGYDPASKKFLHEDSDANAYLLREPRKPWTLTA